MLDSVTINQLRTFVAVCEEGSFSGAAKKLLRAQSAVSHAIAALEQALDMALFDRATRRAELSAAGRNLLPDARSVIARTEEMKTRARAIARFGAPKLSIAADVYFPRPHLIAGLQALQALSPMVAVSRNIGRKRALELLFTGERINAQTALDWGLVNRVVPADRLVEESRRLLAAATRGSAVAKGIGKQSYYAQIDLDQPRAYAYAIEVMASTSQLPHAQEHMQAFTEKRKPRFD